VASGGFLSRRGSPRPVLDALESARSQVDARTGAAFLLPPGPEVRADRLSLFPLLGSICGAHPAAAAELAALTTGLPGPPQGSTNA
jgi:hypothetical protein